MFKSDDPDEVEFVARKIVEKVYQGDDGKIGVARHTAGVAIAALQDYAWEKSEPEASGD